MQRPSSGTSTRSRRDEVWEMKRQRWLAKQRGYPGGAPAAPARGRPPQLSDVAGHGSQAPKSPLSRLVAEGYPTMQQQASAYQPYGERPSSRGTGSLPMRSGSGGGGFDANVAGQWSANVQHDVMHRQNRHDPSVSGPSRIHGGQRITQPSGGNSCIDLSWGAPPQPPQPPQQHYGGGGPPRMPSGGSLGGGSQMGSQRSGGMGGGSYHAGGGAAPPYGDARYGRNPSPSHASRGGGGGGGSCPWGTDADYGQAGRAAQGQRAAPPFGVDAGAGGAGARSNSRGPRAPSPMGYQAGGCFAGHADAAAGARGGRGAMRPPGGASQVVFG